MLKTIEWIERFVVGVLILLLLLAIIMGTINLGWVVVTEIIEPPYLQIEISRLFEMFSLLLIILIGLELLRSVKSYLTHGEIKPEIVVEAAIIAIGNKLITLDITQVAPEMLVGLAATLLGLAGLYFVLKRTAA